ncbi:histidinol dehydrogenase [Roseovarius sp. HI0049]|nr:histidinol dehydrogenase [Roseovarius sp. HI0049]
MAEIPLKSAPGEQPQATAAISDTVREMLATLRTGGAEAARDYANRLDGWDGEIVVSPERIEQAIAETPQSLKDSISWAHDNISRFAAAQRATAQDMEIELRPGLLAGQKQIPVRSAGCYVPGGRYSHIASALMTIATAREAGVPDITACTPPNAAAGGIPSPMLYAMQLAGASRILTLGGVQGVAALAFGLFGGRPADILVLADATAAPETVANDLVGQAEHGPTSPAWLATTDRALAETVLARVPQLIATLPPANRDAATAAWRDFGEVVLCADAEEMAAYADRKAPEHLHVQAADLPWWRERLRAYGSLFLGEATTVAFGDKAAGPNHVLPTSGAARYTGGLSVHKFLKTVTWQQVSDAALPALATATADISRAERMEAHARTADIRLSRVGDRPKRQSAEETG